MGWSFASINGRLAEIYFKEVKGKIPKIWGHCYVDKKSYKTKQEQVWIRVDTKRYRIVYKKGLYKHIIK